MSIRPFPTEMPPNVKKVLLCKYKEICMRGLNCTYAHSIKEQEAWNAELKRRTLTVQSEHHTASMLGVVSSTRQHEHHTASKKRRLGDDGLASTSRMQVHHTASKKPRLEDDVVTSSLENIHEESNLFVKTELFKSLESTIAGMRPKKNCIAILGPKGFGKTTFLLHLRDLYPNDSTYVDLSSTRHGSESITSAVAEKKYVLIDNAQVFREETPLPPLNAIIIAAFSPMRSKTKNIDIGYKSFGRACGSRVTDFFMRPFTYRDTRRLAKSLGYTIVGNIEEEGHKQKKIRSMRLKEVYCTCNGNPSHITDYLMGEWKYVQLNKDVHDEYDESQSFIVQQAIGKSADQINRAIIEVILMGEANRSHLAVKLGLAYCVTSDGLGKFKPSSLYYIYQALARSDAMLSVGQNWQKLEALTQIMIRAARVKVTKAGRTRFIPKANACIIQCEIGDITGKDIKDNLVTLLVLAPNHNIIDSILYDRRATNDLVYFIQTSSLNYADKKKKFEKLHEDPVKNGRRVISRASIFNHYTNFLRHPECKYIYATTSLADYERYNTVYFMDLLVCTPSSTF